MREALRTPKVIEEFNQYDPFYRNHVSTLTLTLIKSGVMVEFRKSPTQGREQNQKILSIYL